MTYLLDTHTLLWVLFEDDQLSEKEAATFYKLPNLKHKDPFDRLIIWQAINRGITLISKDKPVKEYQKFGLNILWQ